MDASVASLQDAQRDRPLTSKAAIASAVPSRDDGLHVLKATEVSVEELSSSLHKPHRLDSRDERTTSSGLSSRPHKRVSKDHHLGSRPCLETSRMVCTCCMHTAMPCRAKALGRLNSPKDSQHIFLKSPHAKHIPDYILLTLNAYTLPRETRRNIAPAGILHSKIYIYLLR